MGTFHSSSSGYNHSWHQKRIIRVTHTHGVELPTSVAHAKKLDEINSNNLWMDAISREMETMNVDSDVLEDGAKIPSGCSKSSGHFVFDALMALERKFR